MNPPLVDAHGVHRGPLVPPDVGDPGVVEVPAFQRVPHTATVVHVGLCGCPPPSAWAGAGELAVGLVFACLGVLLLAAGSTTAAAAGGALFVAALAAARDGLGQLERAVRVAAVGGALPAAALAPVRNGFGQLERVVRAAAVGLFVALRVSEVSRRGRKVIAATACRLSSGAIQWWGGGVSARPGRPRRPRGTLATVARSSVRMTPEAWDIAERAAVALQVSRDAFIEQLLINERHRLGEDDRPVWWTAPVRGDQPALPLDLAHDEEEAPLKRSA